MSEYEIKRQKNIERNKKALEEIMKVSNTWINS